MTGTATRSPSAPLRLVTSTPAPHEEAPRPVVVHALSGRADAVRLAPVIAALERRATFRQVVVHTGGTDDRDLIGAVQADLGLPGADHILETPNGSDAALTAATLTSFDALLGALRPDLVVISGDTNPTLACALAAAKLQIAVAHLESGLRSWDWTTPEEINRVVIDRLSDTLFAHSRDAVDNLLAEGVPEGRVHAVGSTAIDSLRRSEPAARALAAWAAHGLREGEYVLVTLHRPANVAGAARLRAIVDALAELARRMPVLFPVHPRTRRELSDAGALEPLGAAGVRCVDPLGHAAFISLQLGAGAIVTDSAAVQEEASVIGIPCHTMRELSERPITLTHGTNVLLGDDPAAIAAVHVTGGPPVPCAVPLWDGHAGERVADILVANYAVLAGWSSHG